MGLGQAEWELELWVHEETTLDDGEVELKVEVLSSGQTGATIRDVTIDFEDANGTVYRSVEIGTISGLGNETRTVRLEHLPERIRLETGAIEKENEDAEYWIKGVQRTDGEYEQFVQEHHNC